METPKENFQIYLEEEVVEDSRTALGVTQFHPSVPESKSAKPSHHNKQSLKEAPTVPEKINIANGPQSEASPKPKPQEVARASRAPEPAAKIIPPTVPEVVAPVTMERRESSRYSLSVESIAPESLVERPFEEKIAENDKVIPKEDSKIGGKKMSRANSVSKRAKEEVKLPVKDTAIVPKETKEEIKSFVKEVPAAPKVTTIEVLSHSEKEDSMSPTEVKDSLTDNTATTEEGEMRGALPQNFKMRRSKKKFSTKF